MIFWKITTSIKKIFFGKKDTFQSNDFEMDYSRDFPLQFKKKGEELSFEKAKK